MLCFLGLRDRAEGHVVHPVQVEEGVRKVRPVIGKVRPVLGKARTVLVKVHPVLGKACPVLGKVRPVLGKADQVLGKVFPVLGKARPALGEVRPALDNQRAPPHLGGSTSPWRVNLSGQLSAMASAAVQDDTLLLRSSRSS